MAGSKLHDVMVYLCQNYPYPNELSKARLTKLVYLADWRMAITKQKQITPIRWVFNHYGPYVKDVESLAVTSRDFTIDAGFNAFGSPKETIGVRPGASADGLSSAERDVLDFVIDRTKSKTFASFLNLIYSTYPVTHSERYDFLDLVRLASDYQGDADL